MLQSLRKTKEISLLKLTAYRAGEIFVDCILTQTKMLIGADDKADLIIPDQSISHYHAFIFLDEHGGAKIIDLESRNGIYINGENVKEGYLNVGDELKLGNVEFHILEHISEQEVEDQDGTRVVELKEEDIVEKVPELPPREGLVVIDGEYCDIHFKEEEFKPHEDVNVLHGHDFDKHYVDVVEEEEIYDVFSEKDKRAIEVTIMSNGHILHMEYLPLKEKTYFCSSHKVGRNIITLESLETEDAVPFITVRSGKAYCHPLPEHELSGADEAEEMSIEEGDVFVFTKKTVQVFVRETEAPPELKPAPFFGRDVEFQKQTAKIFSGVMAFLLLILFVDTTIEQPKKKLAIIYKKAVRNEKAQTAKANSNTDKNNSNKLNDQPKKKNQMSKAPSKQKAKKVVKKTKKPLPKAAAKKVAKAKAPKKRTYKFNMNNSLNSLFASNTSSNNVKIEKKAKVAGTGIQAAQVSDQGALNQRSDSNIGTLGSDRSGEAANSYGAKGLVSKNGIDTSYIEPKTVVLGSMDPELLRKILQEYIPQFRHCYQQELQETADDLSGVVDLNFQIGGNGKVTKTNIKTKDKRFSNKGIGCMASVLKIIDFPQPKGGGVVDVRQPLNFFAEQNRI